MTNPTMSATPTPITPTMPAVSAPTATVHPGAPSAAAPYTPTAVTASTAPTTSTAAATPAAPMHAAVTDELAIDIIDGRWPGGTAITLEQLQDRFAISRTVAREVAKYLESMQAVTVRRRVGLIARPVSDWAALNTQVIRWKLHSTRRTEQLRSLTELRLAVEPAAAAAAARNAPMEARAMFPVLAAELRKTGESGDLEAFHGLDVRFHELLLTTSGNELFASLSDIIAIVLKGRVELGMYPRKPKPTALDAHDMVAEGIWQGDPGKARQAMRIIVGEVAESLEIA